MCISSDYEKLYIYILYIEKERYTIIYPLLQGTELAALSTPEASLERLVALIGHLAVWKPLPSMSHWVLPEQTLVLLVFLGDDAGLRTVIYNRMLLRPGLMRAGPSGEERGTPHYTVPVCPQRPQEIGLLTLPVFQGAAVSRERFSQFLPPGNVAELRGSPPLWGSLEQLEWPSPIGPLLQGTELAALSIPEASLERLVPLVDYLAAWKLLPNVSRWVMHTVEQGYRGAPPPPFNWVIPTLVGPEQALVMEQEVSTRVGYRNLVPIRHR